MLKGVGLVDRIVLEMKFNIIVIWTITCTHIFTHLCTCIQYKLMFLKFCVLFQGQSHFGSRISVCACCTYEFPFLEKVHTTGSHTITCPLKQFKYKLWQLGNRESKWLKKCNCHHDK